jgi:hypothetical protein
MERWKLWLALLGLIVPIGLVAAALVRPDRGQFAVLRGPVASVHATWENDCGACHVPFKPIYGKTVMASIPGHALTPDQKCQTCHGGPPHFEGQSEETNRCADCHHDHRGRDASLVRLGDRDCTNCHENIAGHGGKANSVLNVAAFPGDHPEFQLIRDKKKDPGHLKFNHELHLAKGLKTAKTGDPHFTLSRLDKADQERYRQPNQTDDVVQLTCSACHRLDIGDRTGAPANVNFPSRSSGAHFLPVSYENDCKACHPLTIIPGSADEKNAAKVTIPHRLQPDQVRDFLWGVYANRQAEKAKPAARPRPIPGHGMTEEERKAREEIQKQVGSAEDFLYRDKAAREAQTLFSGKQTCGECHSFEPAVGQPKKVVPTNVNDVWFQRAVFTHASHRALRCEDCHGANAAPPGVDKSQTAADVLIPGKALCEQCHAPAKTSGDTRHGGARFDCTECHRYHHGEASKQGIGAAARAVSRERQMSIEDFLKGKGP